MIDRHWNGTLWYYNEVENFDKDNSYTALRTESGVSDAAFLGKPEKLVIGEDSGTIQIVELLEVEKGESKRKTLQSLHYACQHDDSLISLSVFEDNNHLVSGGLDCW